MIDRLLAVRDPRGQWQIRRADERDAPADLAAEWMTVDAEWRSAFGEAGERKLLRVLMRLDEDRATVRSLDKEEMVTWQAGATHLAYGEAGFRGQKIEVGHTWTFGKKDDGSFGQTAESHYSTNRQVTATVIR